MAKWIDKTKELIGIFASENRKLVEVTKLNVEISNLEQERKKVLAQIGEYVIGHGLLDGDEEMSGFKTKIGELDDRIEAGRESVNEIRDINVCPICGIEVARKIKFCPRCGMEFGEREKKDAETVKPCNDI